MTTNETARSRGMSLIWSAVFRAAGLLIFGMIGWLWFVSAHDSAWRAISFAALLVFAAIVGITWYLSRVGADRRWRAALDAYAEKEQAKKTYSTRNFHTRPQSPENIGVYRQEVWRQLHQQTNGPPPKG